MLCSVSKALIRGGQPEDSGLDCGGPYFYPNYMKHEEPVSKEDSGWRFYRDDEEERQTPDMLLPMDLERFLVSFESGYLSCSPRPLIRDVPCGYEIDIRHGREVYYCGEKFWFCAIGLWVTNPSQCSLPYVEFIGGYPNEWAVLMEKLSYEQRASIRNCYGTPIIKKIDAPPTAGDSLTANSRWRSLKQFLSNLFLRCLV